MDGMGEASSTFGTNAKHTVLGRKPEEKRPLGRPQHRWKTNIEMDLKQGRVVRTGFIWLRVQTSSVPF
jgi:hypothetical protein